MAKRIIIKLHKTIESRPIIINHARKRRNRCVNIPKVTQCLHVENEELDYDVNKRMKKIPTLISMFDTLCLSLVAWWWWSTLLLKLPYDGPQAFFTNNNGLQHYTTDIEFIGHILPVLTEEREMRSGTKQTWPQADDTLPCQLKLSPSPMITNHNRPLFVSVEHANKVVWWAFIDQGSSLNLLLARVFCELGYTAEDLVRDTRSLAIVNPNTTDTMGVVPLHISVRPFNKPHMFDFNLFKTINMPHMFHVIYFILGWHRLLLVNPRLLLVNPRHI